VLRRSLLAPLTALILAGALVGTSNPAHAAPTGPDAAASTTDAAAPAVGSVPVAVRTATTEQIRAMAAHGNGQLITLGGQAAKGQNTRDSVVMSPMVTCWLSVGTPYGGGAYNRPVYVTAYVYCNDYVDLAVLTVELFHGDDAVGNTYASYVHATQFTVTAASAGCQDGLYYGAAFGTIYRGNSSSTAAVGQPLNMSCAPPPPPPPAPLAVSNPGDRTSLSGNTVSLQMTATGGTTPYTWSATALPTGTSINASTGLISGRTTQTGWWPVVVTARDAAGSTASASFKWTVKNDGCARC